MNHTFRTIGSVATVCAMVLFAASCAKSDFQEEGLNRVPGVKRTISADAGLPATTNSDKAFLDVNDQNKVKWEASDVININGTNITANTVYSGGEVARFKGTARALQNLDQTKDIYWAVYPAVLAGNASDYVPANFSTTGLTVEFPATQAYDPAYDASLINNYSFMAGYTEVAAGSGHIDFQMRNLGAVLAINLGPLAGTVLSNPKVNKIEFLSENASLSGSFVVSTDQTNPTVTPVSDQSAKKVTLALSDGNNKYIDITQGVNIYVVLPPITRKNLKMRIYNTDGYYYEKNSTSTTLDRSYIYNTAIGITSFDKNPPVITVGPNKKVVFAHGNLQWSASGSHRTALGQTVSGTWRIAPNQWDIVGDATTGTISEGGVKCDNTEISETYTGWIDLIGWGTSGWDNTTNDANNKYFQPYSYTDQSVVVSPDYNVYGYGPSTNMTDPNLIATSIYYDWGQFNDIYNPATQSMDAYGTWRLLTIAEWDYLLDDRPTTSGIRFAKAIVHGVCGLLLVPDNWSTATYTLNNYNTPTSAYTSNVIADNDWEKLENEGCVFLPAAGYRDNTLITQVNEFGYYWSSTHMSARLAYRHYFSYDNMSNNDNNYDGNRYRGESVRFVKDVQ